jgi:hypothetical protein
MGVQLECLKILENFKTDGLVQENKLWLHFITSLTGPRVPRVSEGSFALLRAESAAHTHMQVQNPHKDIAPDTYSLLAGSSSAAMKQERDLELGHQPAHQLRGAFFSNPWISFWRPIMLLDYLVIVACGTFLLLIVCSGFDQKFSLVVSRNNFIDPHTFVSLTLTIFASLRRRRAATSFPRSIGTCPM